MLNTASRLALWSLAFILMLPLSAISQSKESKPPAAKFAKKIALTFDNLPGEPIYGGPEQTEINRQVLENLKKHKAPATGFVVGEYTSGEGWEIIVRWLDGGHNIGFHTYSGQDFYGAPPEAFLQDVLKGKEAVEDLVMTYKQKGRYFRYPFLHYPGDSRAKDFVLRRFARDKITVVPATIVVEDFVYNMSFEKILKSGADTLALAKLKSEYLEHIRERLAHYESLAQEVAERPVKQILQLRLNRMNAFFLDDILAELVDKGYKFITITDALDDWIYKEDDTYFGPEGLSYLERVKRSGE